MSRKPLSRVIITPHETGVVVNAFFGHGDSDRETHARGNLGDALDLANELLRPVTKDDGAPYSQNDE